MSEPSIRDYNDIYRLGQADQIAETLKLCQMGLVRPVDESGATWNRALQWLMKQLQEELNEQRAK